MIKGRPFWLSAPTDAGGNDRDAFDQVVFNLDGKFSLCAVVASGLHLATDLIGAGPIYYAASPQRVFYATHPGLVLWLLGQVPAFNRLGVVATLISRAQIERETLFSNVFRLGAGERLSAFWNGSELSLSLARYGDIADALSRTRRVCPQDRMRLVSC